MEGLKKTETIVRLELLAALITARSLSYIMDAFKEIEIPISETYCFTDSSINLCRIKNGHEKYRQWVGNRILEINTLTKKEIWNFCPGPQNPADIPSRAISAACFATGPESIVWWKGPAFIRGEGIWPKQPPPKSIKDPEENPTFQIPHVFQFQIGDKLLEEIVNRFSSWDRFVKTMCYILRFGKKTHRKFQKKDSSTEENRKTEDFIFGLAQKRSFKDETDKLSSGKEIAKDSKLKNLTPTWNAEKQLIISQSRLVMSHLPEETVRPVILPRNCSIVDKYIQHVHEVTGHSGPGYTLSILNERVRILQAMRQVKKILHKCVAKRCVRPRPLTQQMAPLPNLRTDNEGAFRYVSVDLFGPLIARHECDNSEADSKQPCPHTKQFKVWVALFTCFHSRAVHLELMWNATTFDFLQAFRLFVARRGTPNKMFSDNATNFKAADKEIRLLYKSIDWNEVKKKGVLQNIDWYFNVELAPWANAVAERMVRSVKKPLKLALGNSQLTARLLQVVLVEVESLINNRPLAPVSDENETPITPAQLIIGRKMTALPDPNLRDNKTTFPEMWRKRQLLLNQFWQQWKNEYLLQLNCRKIWQSPQEKDLLNRIVLINDPSMSRSEWKIGRIIEVQKSKDNLIRTVIVQTPTSKLRRPVQRISVFENVI